MNVGGKMLIGSADDLMPTEDSIRQIASNQSLLAGFDDPEVMRAVQDVAQHPANIQKYKSNKKVTALTVPSHANRTNSGNTASFSTTIECIDILVNIATCCVCVYFAAI